MRRCTVMAWLCVLWFAAARGAAGEVPAYSWDRIERVVAFADVHGAYPELVSLLQTVGIIDADLRWKAGTTHLVSLGDLLDRGAASRRVMDLLMRLENEAQAAGGRVHVVLGNHEMMNLAGELDYVSPAEFASYRDLESDAMRSGAFQALQSAGRFAGRTPEQARADFDSLLPRGYLGHREAFAPGSPYGKWLLDRPLLIRINETIFVHGGLPPALATMSLASANETLRADLIAYVRSLRRLQDARLIDIDTPFGERVALARRRFEQGMALPERPQLAQAIDELERTGASPVHDPRGPLWYRGTALCNALYETDVVRAALRALRAKDVVMGHTVTPELEVMTRLDRRATLLDNGMLTLVYRGRPAALVLEHGSRKVVYAGSAAKSAQPQPERRRVGARPSGMDDDAVEAFLARAEIVSAEPTSGQAQGALLLTLRQGEVTLRALFRAGRSSFWEREIAAYRFDRRIGLDMIPATVAREYRGQRGALQLQIDDAESLAALEQRQARVGGWCPLDAQYNLMAVFDALIDNSGRSPANIWLSPSEWLVRLTDHSRAFSASRQAPQRARELTLPDELVRRLSAITREQLAAELGQWLKPAQIDALLARRDELLRLREKRSARDDLDQACERNTIAKAT